MASLPTPTPTPTPSTLKFPQPPIAIVGDSGTGKTRSYKSVDWARTIVIDSEIKGFSFPDTLIPPAHYIKCATYQETDAAIKKVKAGGFGSQIKFVIHDSLLKYQGQVLEFAKRTKTGYDIYNHYNDTIREYIKSIKQEHLVFISICAPELVEIVDDMGKKKSAIRIYTFGNELAGKLEHDYTIVLHTRAIKNATTGKMEYWFLTNNDGICSAKTPEGMFDTQLIPNDLRLVLDKLEKKN